MPRMIMRPMGPSVSVRMMRQQMVGDPFLGGLIRAIGGIGRVVAPIIARGIGLVPPAAAGPVPSFPQAPAAPVQRLLPGAPPLPGVPGPGPIIMPFPPAALPVAAPVARAAGAILLSISLEKALKLGWNIARDAFNRLLAYGPAGEVAQVRRRRRMNVLNPRALRRSLTRVNGFARFASRTLVTSRRVRIKKRRRR